LKSLKFISDRVRSLATVGVLVALLGAGPIAVKDSPPDAPSNWPPPVQAPMLSAEEAIKTMKLAPGFRIEVVATEPLVEHPVAMSFDPQGRAWVAEMRSYMPNVEGTGETAPTGRISVLEDTDGDGRMDRSTIFMDNLVLPRAIACVRGGALVAVPPKLLFCRDTNGDGRSDEQTVVATDYGITGNPEHQPNGLMTGIDNWIYSANYDKRIRFVKNNFISEQVREFGQWGVSQDDWGRLFHNNNTDQLRGSIVPPHYVERNPHYRADGSNEQIAKDQTVWPLHPTAVDRGYLENIMRPDGTLRNFTAACAPVIYRGGLFPAEFSGNAFVCEPAANLIKRDIISDLPDGTLSAKQAYAKSEFLASTYERFRPVNLNVGPDGALYVLDMHHGLLQHKTYLTTYCKDQYLARNLDKHLMTGRIYRIVPTNSKPTTRPNLAKATSAELVAALSNPNGWWRDMAQQLLVERQDFKTLPALRRAAVDTNPIARLHALWTLEGMGVTDPKMLKVALADSEPKIRAAALRLCEAKLYSANRELVLPIVLGMKDDPHPVVRLQFALTVSPLGLPETDAALTRLLGTASDQPYLRDAIISGIGGRELPFLENLLGSVEFSSATPARAATLTALTHSLFTEASPKRIGPLLELVARQTGPLAWRQAALLDGLQPFDPARHRSIMLETEPVAFVALVSSATEQAIKAKAANLLKVVHWPGQPGFVPPPPPVPLTPVEQARFEKGKQVYAGTCAACHKPAGLGQEGLAPPLVDSEWVLGPKGRLMRIVLGGLQGPVTVGSRTYSLEMPTLAKLTDDEIASVLTYVRREWGHSASAVLPEEVAAVRAQIRPVPWTERELLQITDDVGKKSRPKKNNRNKGAGNRAKAAQSP
jgi:mono/diheme cytochrome c family protein/glucose/arabinose dehydrogenase